MSETITEAVKSKYGSVATSGLSTEQGGVKAVAEAFGYTPEELASIPAEANMALSCGNPTATAGLKPGETVVDLGSGGGLDVFLAARKVGPTGRAIGIDMTEEMIALARRNAEKAGLPNVEFHLAAIDRLPLADASADCVISNCVINLAPDKAAVFREIARVLKPGGRLAISDIALKRELPPELGNDLMAYVGCIAGAILIEDYREGPDRRRVRPRRRDRQRLGPERLRPGREPGALLPAADRADRPGLRRAGVLLPAHGPVGLADRRGALLHASRRVVRSSSQRGCVLLGVFVSRTRPGGRRCGLLLGGTGGGRGRGVARPAGRPAPAVRRERLRRQREGLRRQASVRPARSSSKPSPLRAALGRLANKGFVEASGRTGTGARERLAGELGFKTKCRLGRPPRSSWGRQRRIVHHRWVQL